MRRGLTADEDKSVNLSQLFPGQIAQVRHVFHVRLCIRVGAGCAEAADAGHIFRAGAVIALLSAAVYKRGEGQAGTDIKRARAFGGMDLLDSTLNTNFGVEIAGNVEVDFGEFQTLIDSIGGIDLELTQDEADYICGRKRDVTYPQQLRTDWNLHEGVNHLTGEQALIHARNRSLGNDYARTDRQRAVLMAITNKVKQMDAVSIVNFINQVLPLLTTDMTSGEILGYAMEALQMNFDSEHSYRIPAEGTYTGAVIRGMQVLVPDLAANQTYLMDVLYHTDNNQ